MLEGMLIKRFLGLCGLSWSVEIYLERLSTFAIFDVESRKSQVHKAGNKTPFLAWSLPIQIIVKNLHSQCLDFPCRLFRHGDKNRRIRFPNHITCFSFPFVIMTIHMISTSVLNGMGVRRTLPNGIAT